MRLLVALLLAANLAYLGWSRGLFAGLGFEPARHAESEPQRLRNQLRADALVIRRPGASSAAPAAAVPASASSGGEAPASPP
ncbi:MAG: sporulation protein [Comamonadaceae bacterium]|nr:MAG: sporulation protein [Comamonadaceae bacterium]